jgi:type I restriction enzyme S subunit
MENNLPKGWVIKKLVDHVPIIKTGVEKFSGNKPYYSTGSISDKEFTPEGDFSFENRPARANRLVLEKDVVQARMKETHKALLVDKRLAGSLISTGFLQFRPEEHDYDSKLFYYYLCSPMFLKQRDEYATGSTQVALTDEGAEKIDLIIPPEDVHKHIADKLDGLLAKVKDVQSRLDTIPVILNRFRQSVLAAAFSGELTKTWRKKGAKEEWREAKLGEVLIDLKYGTARKCFKDKKKHPVLRIPNVVQGYIDLNDLKYADLDKKEYENLKLESGDILLIRSNGSVSLVGRTALVTDKEKGMAYAGYLIRLRVNKELILPEFLQYQFQSYAMRLQIELPARSTSGVNNINSKEVKNLMISLPPLDEQEEIVKRLKSSFSFIEKNENEFKKAKSYTDKLEQSILAKAFRGELVT